MVDYGAYASCFKPVGMPRMRLLLAGCFSLGLLFSASVAVAENAPTSSNIERDPTALLNQFYHLKGSNPRAAKHALDLLLARYPNNLTGVTEMGYWYLDQKQDEHALDYFMRAHELNPRDAKLSLQIGYLLIKADKKTEAKNYFTKAVETGDAEIRRKAEAALLAMNPEQMAASPQLTTKEKVDGLLNQYYQIHSSQPEQAEKLLEKVIELDPRNYQALTERGFYQIKHKNKHAALEDLLKAYEVSPDEAIAAQIGYLYADDGKYKESLEFFEKLKDAKDEQLRKRARSSIAVLEEGIKTQKKWIELPEPKTQQDRVNQVLNEYYRIKTKRPEQAQKKLAEAIAMDPKNFQALTERGFYQLQHKNKHAALEDFLKAYAVKPDENLAAQIGYLYADEHKNKEAIEFFKKLKDAKDEKLRKQARNSIIVLQGGGNIAKKPLESVPKTEADRLFDQFYQLKKKNPRQAEKILDRLLDKYPDNVQALKEKGYLALDRKDYEVAYEAFHRAYVLTKEDQLALQVGYVLNGMKRNHEAYHYFALAARSKDKKISFKGNLSMTNLAGAETLYLPDPMFADIYVSPFYYSRFDLAVVPLIARAGIYLDPKHSTELYYSLRATHDDRSLAGAVAVSPIIFDDNVAIIGMGIRNYPIPKIPLYVFGEVGRAYDFVFRDRPRWRNDIRGGAVYGNTWGAKPTYTDSLKFSLAPVADAYGDAIYYTRYDHNFIADERFRPGVRVVQYKASYIDFYVKELVVGDTNHEFFNNYFEWGPGVVIVPYNPYSFDFRFETVRGYYFKVNSPDPNPYGPHYNNRIALAELYVKF